MKAVGFNAELTQKLAQFLSNRGAVWAHKIDTVQVIPKQQDFENADGLQIILFFGLIATFALSEGLGRTRANLRESRLHHTGQQ